RIHGAMHTPRRPIGPGPATSDSGTKDPRTKDSRIGKIFGRAVAKNLCDAVETCASGFSRPPHRERLETDRNPGVPGKQENFSMVCSMVKKGLLGAALGAGTLFLVFGTSAPSYIKTAFCRMRQSAKDAIDPQFEIERAKSEIANLQPAFDQNKETLARAEVAAEHLEAEIGRITANLDHAKPAIPALRDTVKGGAFGLPGHVADAAEGLKAQIASRWDHYNYTTAVLKEKHDVLKAKRQMIEAAHRKLEALREQKSNLLARLAKVEAKLQTI